MFGKCNSCSKSDGISTFQNIKHDEETLKNDDDRYYMGQKIT